LNRGKLGKKKEQPWLAQKLILLDKVKWKDKTKRVRLV